MNQEQVWNVLSQIPIGTIVAWCVAFAVIIGIIATTVLKLYKAFLKIQEKKTMVTTTQQRIAKHDEQLDNIDASLQAIYTAMKKSIRHDIVLSCEEAIDKGVIKAGQLRALEELYESYAEIGGNSYATTLMKKVRNLPVVGTLDD